MSSFNLLSAVVFQHYFFRNNHKFQMPDSLDPDQAQRIWIKTASKDISRRLEGKLLNSVPGHFGP